MLEPGKECSVCGSDSEEEEGGVQGFFGIVPVTFCTWCLNSIRDMCEQMFDPIEEDEE
jgi:hypothetical protein